MRGIFEKIEMTEETFKAAPFTRLLQLKQLVRSNQVDDSLHWRGHDLS